jgi:hypothetical protein
MRQQKTIKKRQQVCQKVSQRQNKSKILIRNQKHPFVQVQNMIGNHSVLNSLGNQSNQTKLVISNPGDKHEQEASRVADQIMNQSKNLKKEKNIPLQITSKSKTFGKEVNVTPKIRNQLSSLKGRGQPLGKSLKGFFEPYFGNLRNVRIHANEKSTKLANSFQAKAFTIGDDIVFSHRHYLPATQDGRKLLAHELTHVAQQRSRKSSGTSQVRIYKEEKKENQNDKDEERISSLSREEFLSYELDRYGREKVLESLVKAQKDAIDQFHETLKGKADSLTNFWPIIGAAAGGGLGHAYATRMGFVGGVSAGAGIIATLLAAAGIYGVVEWTKSGIEKFLKESKQKCHEKVESHGRSYQPTVSNLAKSFAKRIASGQEKGLTTDISNLKKIREEFRTRILQAPSTNRVFDLHWNLLCKRWNNYLRNSDFWNRYHESAWVLLMKHRKVRP